MQNQPDFIPPSIRDRGKQKKSNLLGVSLALLLAVGAFFSGFHANELISKEGQTASIFSFFSSKETVANTQEDIDLEQFWKVWKLLDEKFTSASSTLKVTSEDRINGAIQGMVSAYGDPYTVFMPPAQSADFSEDISGNFSGIGMEVGIKDKVITVISPLPNTPAEKAGLLPGDLVVKIDGESTESMSIDDAVNRIRGEKGTNVTLSIYREGATEVRDFTITRDTIDIPTVKTELKEDVFIIRLYSFNAISEAKMQEAMREFVNSKAKFLVLDLRGNPGGYLQSAVAIASFYLPTGKVVVKENFGDKEEEKVYRSQGRVIKDFNPNNLVVLVDNGSASASEILAGALKEQGVATVIGTNTFGKGSVQELVDLPEGASLKVTVARWLTPNGISISLKGLEPNIYINRTPQQRLENADPQQDSAIKFLHGDEVKSEEKK
jgi:carboxyl-terminal processing protease